MSFNLAQQLYANHRNAEVFPEPQHGIKNIGIMTCGGDCPGLNPVIRAVVLSAARKYGWKVLGIEDAMQGLINLDYKSPYGNISLPPFVVEDIISNGGTIIGTDNKSDPFRFKMIGPDGAPFEGDVSDTVIENYHKLNLDALIVVGGDGTMRIAHKLFLKVKLQKIHHFNSFFRL
jgi:ATP-dependent phosphofructokinase / diphosphate-dependent phosphofructokinase